MFIYTLVLSAIILGLLGISMSASNSFYSGSANQEILGQILASNLKTSLSCKENLDLAYDSTLSFNATAASSDSGQDVKVKIPQWPGMSTSTDNILQPGKDVESMNLQVQTLNISNARLINTSGNIKTYHGVLSVQTKQTGLLGSSFARKPASYLSISVDTANGNRVTHCSEDNSDTAICSRYGGVYNAGGVPKCSMAAPSVKCADGQILVGIGTNQEAICQSYIQQCPVGKYMSGYKTDGSIDCVDIPATSGGGGSTGGPTTTTTTLPGPKSSTGVWVEKAHSVNDVTCPRFLMPDRVNDSPDGIKGRACYTIGYQCREIICGYGGGIILARNTGTRPCSGTSKGETPIQDHQLECVEGTPSVGSNRTVPDGALKTSAKPTTKASPDLTPPNCYNGFHCSVLGETCKIENIDLTTGLPTGTADIYTCEENKEEFGHIKYLKIMNVSLPGTCDPVDLPITDPRFLEWLSLVGLGTSNYSWCQYFEMQKLTNGAVECGPLQEGMSCNNLGHEVCFERVNAGQAKVYSCQ